MFFIYLCYLDAPRDTGGTEVQRYCVEVDAGRGMLFYACLFSIFSIRMELGFTIQ